MEKVAIVILNYLNSSDTLNCIKSIQNIGYTELCGIVVVDNNSDEKSFNILKNVRKSLGFDLIRLPKNQGFAKGNNVGINYARNKYHTDYILVVNNDTLFIDSNMLKTLINNCDSETALIGPQIRQKKGFIQNRYIQPIHFPFILYPLIEYIYRYIGMENKADNYAKKWKSDGKEMLHGCVLFFTPIFFRFYNGFFSKTFMYCEENILYFMLDKIGKNYKYVEETELIHLEDQSTKKATKNVTSFRIKNLIVSYSKVIFVRFIPYRILKKMC